LPNRRLPNRRLTKRRGTVLKPYKVLIANLNFTKVGFIRKFRAKRFRPQDDVIEVHDASHCKDNWDRSYKMDQWRKNGDASFRWLKFCIVRPKFSVS
jgi:hypothetical protein